MELNAVLNDNLEIDYFESNEKSGAISKRITVEKEDGYFDVKEVICNGSKIIYANEFVLSYELLDAIYDIKDYL